MKNEARGGVKCGECHPIVGNKSTANMWHEKVTIGDETDNNFTRIPLGVYDLEPRVKILKFQNVALNSIEPGDVQDLHRLIINGRNSDRS